MANLQFLRGTQANLNKLNSTTVQDGAFYLTTDTNRLYVGQGTDLVELNKSVTIVDKIKQEAGDSSRLTYLPTANIEDGQFYYVRQSNILCVYDSTTTTSSKWVQINPDTDTDTKTDIIGVTLSKNSAATGITLDGQLDWKKTDINGMVSDQTPINFTETTITADDFKKVLKADLDTNDITNGAKVSLSMTGIDNTLNNSVNIIGDTVDTTVTVTEANDIKISVDTIKSINVETENNNSEIKLTTIKQTNMNGPSVDFTDALRNHLITYVYTENEIDNKIQELKDELRQLDAVVYRGTLGDGGTISSLPTSEVKVGDAYKVITSGTYDGQLSKVGDLFIATGTEDSTTGIITSNLNWTYIPSGDDTDSQFIFDGDETNKTITLKNKTLSNTAGSFKIDQGKQIITSLDITTDDNNSGDVTTFTVAHAPITTTPANSESTVRITDTTKQNVISGITVDNGHITGYTTQTINTNDYEFSRAETYTSDNNSITTTLTLSSSDSIGRGEYNSTLTSTSLELQHSGTAQNGYTTTINLVWGSF